MPDERRIREKKSGGWAKERGETPSSRAEGGLAHVLRVTFGNCHDGRIAGGRR
jgi:hypothetical protein